MDDVAIYVLYGGVWDNNERKYIGGSLKGTYIRKGSTYDDLIAELYDVVGVDRSKFDIVCQYHVEVGNQSFVIDLSNNRDVLFYLRKENILDCPLCLSFKTKDVAVNEVDILNVPSAFGQTLDEEVRMSLEEENVQFNTSVFDSSEFQIVHVPNALGRECEEEVRMATEEDNEVTMSRDGHDNNGFWNVDINNFTFEPNDIDAGTGSPVEEPPAACSQQTHGSKGHLSEGSSTCNELEVGQLFSSKRELSFKLNVVAMKKNFEFKVKKSTKKILYVKCVDENCKWKLRGLKLRGSDVFKISKFCNVHSCSLDILNHDHRQVKHWVVGDLIKSKYKEAGRQYRPRDIIQDMRQDYGVNLSYDKAWRSRENALMRVRGSPEESYNILSRYGEALKIANPGTIYDIELEDGLFFKYLFMALGPCIRGFLNCIRPVITMDGTFLKNKYRGTLLIATCLDGNNQIYPLAFGIVDRETDASITWFLEKLHGAIGQREDLVFVTDRSDSIARSIASVFPNAFHCLCVQHLRQNLKSKFKCETIDSLFYNASRAYRESKFEEFWGRIRSFDNGVGRYLEAVGISRWARIRCPKKRYNLMTTNIAECMNGVLKEPRAHPVAALLEHIRDLLQRWFWERREEACKVTSSLTKWAERIVHESHNESLGMKVDPIDCYRCHVKDVETNDIVNLQTMDCSCNSFQLEQLPCAHAVAAARDRSINVYSLCSHYYTNECLLAAYAEPIVPVGMAADWKTSENYVDITVLPPKVVTRVGRRRTVRIPSVGETRRVVTCGRCGEKGHNRTTCNNPIAYTDH